MRCDDSNARVAVETLIKGGDDWCKVVVAGEIRTRATPFGVLQVGRDPSFDETLQAMLGITTGPRVARHGRDDLEVLNLLTSRSLLTSPRVSIPAAPAIRASCMGYATNETLRPAPMPIRCVPFVPGTDPPHPGAPFVARHSRIPIPITHWRTRSGRISNPRSPPNTMPNNTFIGVKRIILAIQHHEDISASTIKSYANGVVRDVMYDHFGVSSRPEVIVNGTGKFVVGGPAADAGVTGRKIIVDTYGGLSRHGGGAFSGKDPTKVDRSAAYAARWAAKHVVAAGLASRCEIQLAYVIGWANPVSVHVDTFGTGVISNEELSNRVNELFDFTPKAIIERLRLRDTDFSSTAFGGHFGRASFDRGDRATVQFPWEKLDADILRDLACTQTVSAQN